MGIAWGLGDESSVIFLFCFDQLCSCRCHLNHVEAHTQAHTNASHFIEEKWGRSVFFKNKSEKNTRFFFFPRKTFRRRVLQKIVGVCHTMHIHKHHSFGPECGIVFLRDPRFCGDSRLSGALVDSEVSGFGSLRVFEPTPKQTYPRFSKHQT